MITNAEKNTILQELCDLQKEVAESVTDIHMMVSISNVCIGVTLCRECGEMDTMVIICGSDAMSDAESVIAHVRETIGKEAAA